MRTTLLLRTPSTIRSTPLVTTSRTMQTQSAPSPPVLFSALVAPDGKWKLSANGRGLERSFRFRGFKKCWEFMNRVAAEAARQNHHPEWSNVYNTAFVRWTTHAPPSLSEKDVLMARFCDQSAAELGELPMLVNAAVDEGPMADDIRILTDKVALIAGNCCVPSKK